MGRASPRGDSSCSKTAWFGGRGPISKGQGVFGDRFSSSPMKKLSSGGAPGLQTVPPNCPVQMLLPHSSPSALQPKARRLRVRCH